MAISKAVAPTRVPSPPGDVARADVTSVLSLIRSGEAQTRAELVARTGLSRSTVAQRLAALMARDLVVSAGEIGSTGGRPATTLAFNGSAGVVLAAALGATARRVGVVDLSGRLLASRETLQPIADGPDEILPAVGRDLEALMQELPLSFDDVWGVGVGLPGPVELGTGRPERPLIMPGWDGYPVGEWFQQRFRVPTLVENDVNVMALGERAAAFPNCQQFLFIKVDTGIGAGLVADGNLYRGAQGCAGDIGHTHLPGHDEVVCSCGNTGCVEAVVGGQALAARLTAAGLAASNATEVAEHALAREAVAVREVRHAGREIGTVLAALVNAFNPSVMVIGGGGLSLASADLLASIREVVYRSSPPLATRDLQIVSSRVGRNVGVIGAGVLIAEHVLARVSSRRRTSHQTGPRSACGRRRDGVHRSDLPRGGASARG